MTRRAAYIFAEVIHTYAHVNREFQPGASSVSWRNTSFNPSTFLHLCHVLRLLCIYANENARDSFRTTAHMEEKGSLCCGDICSPHLCRWWPWSIALGNPRVIYNEAGRVLGADSFQLLLAYNEAPRCCRLRGGVFGCCPLACHACGCAHPCCCC